MYRTSICLSNSDSQKLYHSLLSVYLSYQFTRWLFSFVLPSFLFSLSLCLLYVLFTTSYFFHSLNFFALPSSFAFTFGSFYTGQELSTHIAQGHYSFTFHPVCVVSAFLSFMLSLSLPTLAFQVRLCFALCLYVKRFLSLYIFSIYKCRFS